MKTTHVATILSVLALAGAACAQEFVEGVNNEIPVDDVWTATRGNEQAFRWTPQNSFDLSQILWHSSPITNGIIRLREDTGTVPGAVLREVSFSSTTSGWNGVEFDEPYAVVAGQTYFVAFNSLANDYREFICQNIPSATVLTYYWQPEGGGAAWNGPFTFAGRRMIEFYAPGDGCRVDLDGDGSLTIFDFLEFQNLFASGDMRADFDGDGSLTIFDFLQFQNEFAEGCD